MASKIISFTRDLSVASGNVSYTGTGFQPSTVIIFGAQNGLAFGSLGFADQSKNMGVLLFGFGATGLLAQNGANVIFVEADNTGSNNQSASVVSYDSNGFTLSWTKTGSPTGTWTFYALCLA